MKLLNIILLLVIIWGPILWAVTCGGPLYMRDLDGKLHRIPGTRSPFDILMIIVGICMTIFGIINIINH